MPSLIQHTLDATTALYAATQTTRHYQYASTNMRQEEQQLMYPQDSRYTEGTAPNYDEGWT
jgi:hypothetical protein